MGFRAWRNVCSAAHRADSSAVVFSARTLSRTASTSPESTACCLLESSTSRSIFSAKARRAFRSSESMLFRSSSSLPIDASAYPSRAWVKFSAWIDDTVDRGENRERVGAKQRHIAVVTCPLTFGFPRLRVVWLVADISCRFVQLLGVASAPPIDGRAPIRELPYLLPNCSPS